MNNEHPAVAYFRSACDRVGPTPPDLDRAFVKAIAPDVEGLDPVAYPALHAALQNARGWSGNFQVGTERAALADYDRLIASRTQVEHPDIVAYRAALDVGHGVEAGKDCAFFKAILADERVRDALFDDNEEFSILRSEMGDCLIYGYIANEAGALADYDAIVGNVKPVVEQVKAAEAKLGDSLNSMARTLDTLAEEFRKIADTL